MKINIDKYSNDLLEEISGIKDELEKIRQQNIDLENQIDRFKGILVQYGIVC